MLKLEFMVNSVLKMYPYCESDVILQKEMNVKGVDKFIYRPFVCNKQC